MRLWLAVAAAALGCSAEDVVATRPCPPGQDCGDDRDAYCEGEGPPVLAGDGSGGGELCAGEVAASSFTRAVCACDSLDNASTLTTDAFDSREGPYVDGGFGGAVATNGKLQIAGPVTIGGDLLVAGGEGVSIDTTLEVAGSLASAGPLRQPAARIRVGADAAVGGDVALTELQVAGTLTLPPDAALDVSERLAVGEERRAEVAVQPACACNPTAAVDVGGIVEAHRLDNHNAAIALDAAALADFGDAEPALALPCGRYYLQRIQGRGALSIEVSGRVALFVAQAVTLDRDWTIALAPDAELDLFIAGNINTAGVVRVGDRDAPARVRVYVRGAGAISLAATSELGGNLYAPTSDLVLSGGARIFGAVFVNRLIASAPVTVHYDRAVRAAGDACPAP